MEIWVVVVGLVIVLTLIFGRKKKGPKEKAIEIASTDEAFKKYAEQVRQAEQSQGIPDFIENARFKKIQLLSVAEKKFLDAIKKESLSNFEIYSKVRVADVISPVCVNRSHWQKAFNSISAKHFDFVVCNASDQTVRFAIELDDSSHETDNRKKRDDLLNKVCEKAQLKLVRVKAAKSYNEIQIKQIFDTGLNHEKYRLDRSINQSKESAERQTSSAITGNDNERDERPPQQKSNNS